MDDKDCDTRLFAEAKVVLIKQSGLFNDREVKTIDFLTWLRVTSSERIASVLLNAIADRTMIIDSAFGILSASSGARINAFLIRASLII